MSVTPGLVARAVTGRIGSGADDVFFWKGSAVNLASTFPINGTFVFFDGVETVPSVAATTGADITPVTAISEDVTGVTSV